MINKVNTGKKILIFTYYRLNKLFQLSNSKKFHQLSIWNETFMYAWSEVQLLDH